MEKPISTSTPDIQGNYSKDEREHFNEVLRPGAAVALESLRKQSGIRLKVTRHNRNPNSERSTAQD